VKKYFIVIPKACPLDALIGDLSQRLKGEVGKLQVKITDL
jgi:hypothetical protein